MAIELTGANWGLLGGLILIGLIVFALRSVLSPLIIVLIIIIVLPMFGISFLGLVNVGNAGAVGKAPPALSALQLQLLQSYQTKTTMTDAEVIQAGNIIPKAQANPQGMTREELTAYPGIKAKFDRLTRTEQQAFLELAKRQAAIDAVFTVDDATRMVALLNEAGISGPIYNQYFALKKKEIAAINRGQILNLRDRTTLARIQAKLDTISTAKQNELIKLFRKSGSLQGTGLVNTLVNYSKEILNWVLGIFGQALSDSVAAPGTVPTLRIGAPGGLPGLVPAGH